MDELDEWVDPKLGGISMRVDLGWTRLVARSGLGYVVDLVGGLLLVEWVVFELGSGLRVVSCCCRAMAHGCRGWVRLAIGFMCVWMSL